jgi:hypothetical protein
MNSLMLRLRVRILKFAEVTLAVKANVTGKKVL